MVHPWVVVLLYPTLALDNGGALDHGPFHRNNNIPINLSMENYRGLGLATLALSLTIKNRRAERQSPNHNERTMSYPVAFVLLEGPVTLNESALVEALRQRHPDARWDIADNVAQAGVDRPIIIRGGDSLVVVIPMPAPLPRDRNRLWKRASRIWPEAPEIAGRHRAHLVVSTIGPAENNAGIAHLTHIGSARLTTAVVGGLIAVTPGCCAVAWGAAVGHSAQMWLDTSRSAFAAWPNHPFSLWIDIIPYSSGHATAAITLGLSAFVDREIEFEVDGMDRATVIYRVAHIAFYLIQHGLGAMIKDGTTIEGDSEADRVKVRYRTSRFTGSPVLAIGPERNIADWMKSYPVIPASIARDHPLLIMLGKAGLFDASSPENQIQLRAAHYVSEVRMESYDKGLIGVLSNILATDAYAEADEKARRALAIGNVETARSALMPFAKEVGEFQQTTRLALTLGDLHMFRHRPHPADSP
jgi:hypothetical protein